MPTTQQIQRHLTESMHCYLTGPLAEPLDAGLILVSGPSIAVTFVR
jgi:hypothetical protein